MSKAAPQRDEHVDHRSAVGTTICRFCSSERLESVVDLGKTPLCETFLSADELLEPEIFYPLHAKVCRDCHLMQVGEFVPPDVIFTRDYPYFSSYSHTWVEHARAYADDMVKQLDLDPDSLVVELGSNDGYLLQHFLPHGVPVLGIEPSGGVAEAARDRGVDTRVEFFGASVANAVVDDGALADLVIGNNVLAQVPDLNDFVAGIAVLLKPTGVVTIEVPHVLRLLDDVQFDTIYHEHFSYFSLHTFSRIFERHGLSVFDVVELTTHGGSLRVFAAPTSAQRATTDRVTALEFREERAGITRPERYRAFGEGVRSVKRQLLRFLIDAVEEGHTVAGYGAPGKANTLLNYCGIGPDLLPFTADLNPGKQGRFTPGTHIPIHDPGAIDRHRPDFIVILPWNLRWEIEEQLAHARDWGARFVIPLPDVTVE